MSTETFDQIVKWSKLINEKPNYSCTHFYLSENRKAMIIDLSRMETMPAILKQLSEKENSYLFIDLDVSKSFKYYAYDISPGTFEIVNEISGEILASAVEKDVLKYIENNINDISTHHNPMTRLVEMFASEYERKSEKSLLPVHSGHHSSSFDYGGSRSMPQHQHQYNNGYNYNNNFYYGGANYKEREQFLDGVYACVKQGKTSTAVDLIYDFVEKKKDDKEMMNSVFKTMSLDKLDLVSLKELLITTAPLKEMVHERDAVLQKFKNIITKTKPSKAQLFLKDI